MTEWTKEKSAHLEQAINLLNSQKKNTFIPATENVLKAAKCLRGFLDNLPSFMDYDMNADKGLKYYQDFHQRFNSAFDEYDDWLDAEFKFEETA